MRVGYHLGLDGMYFKTNYDMKLATDRHVKDRLVCTNALQLPPGPLQASPHAAYPHPDEDQFYFRTMSRDEQKKNPLLRADKKHTSVKQNKTPKTCSPSYENEHTTRGH